MGAVFVIVALLPFVIGVGHSFLMSQICIYGVIALSLTVLTGWSGQVSLGQFGLVAVGTDLAAHVGTSVPLILLAAAGRCRHRLGVGAWSASPPFASVASIWP